MAEINNDCIIEVESTMFQSANCLGLVCKDCGQFVQLADVVGLRKWKMVPVTGRALIGGRKYIDHYDAYCSRCKKT